MTKEEAIEFLEIKIHCADKGDERDIRKAMDMAIEALKQEPCEDCISRQAVLDIYDEWFACCDIADKKESPKAKIKALPSVQSIRPKGKWMNVLEDIYHCSLCKKSYCFKTNYCPNCGAKMESEEK